MISETRVRVNYSEVDQMGVVYHARYVVWLDVARTEHMRAAGMSYREVEDRGFRLAVAELRIRFRQAARYDDQVRVRCWVRDKGSRQVTFGYALEEVERGTLLATAETLMISLSHDHRPARLPEEILGLLQVTPDPLRL